MNSKALISAPLLVLSFIFSDSSGMNFAEVRAMKARVLRPFIDERDRCRQALAQEQINAEILRQQAEAERQRIAMEHEQERQRIIAEQEQERQRFIVAQEQERQRAEALEAERQRIAMEHEQKCRDAEAMQRRLNEEEAQLRQTQREAEEARQARQQILAEQEQARQQAEQERINKMVDLDKLIDGIALLKQKSMTTIPHANVLFLEKYNMMISMPEGSSKGIKITTDYMLGKTLNAKSNELTELMLCGLFAQLLDEIGLTGSIFELYRLIPDFPDPNELIGRRRHVFEKTDDIIKNGAISLRSKAIYLKSYIDDAAASRGSKLSILENDRIDTCEARWFYYFLYSILYEDVQNYSSRRVISSRNSSEERTCCVVCEVS